jgi:hypothetical protein
MPEGEVLLVKGQHLEAKLRGFKLFKIDKASGIVVLNAEEAASFRLLRLRDIEVSDLRSSCPVRG